MTSAERGTQVWAVLTCAAKNRQILTYQLLGDLIGLQKHTLTKPLDAVFAYCREQDLPPLTVLVVSTKTGRPALDSGLEDVPEEQREAVFKHEWFRRRPPTAQELEQAASSA